MTIYDAKLLNLFLGSGSNNWVPARMATMRNLNTKEFQNKTCISGHLDVEVKMSRLQICWYLQEGQLLFILGQWNCAVQFVSFNNFLTRDICFEMKSSLGSAASSILHEVNFN